MKVSIKNILKKKKISISNVTFECLKTAIFQTLHCPFLTHLQCISMFWIGGGGGKFSKHNIWIPPLLYVQVYAPLIWRWYCYIYRCVLANFREHLPLITSELYDDGFTNSVWAVMSAVHCTAIRPARGRVHDGAEVTAASESFLLGRLWLQLSVFILRMGPLSPL